jgi:Cu(I)/Ag(I) efflux system membrane protein CusA/SilA
MLRDEGGLLTGYVYIDVAGRDASSYVEDAARVVRDQVALPPGYAAVWSGRYEAIERVLNRLKLVLPVTLLLVFILLYAHTRSLAKTFIVLLAVPFSGIGAVWLLYLLGYNQSVAVWVGLIALLGVDAETGIFMILYLDLACEQARREGRLHGIVALHEAIHQGAVKRLRPKFMTVATMMLGLVPIMWCGDRRGRHEAHRSPADRRNRDVVRPGATRLPCHIRDLEVAIRVETWRGGAVGGCDPSLSPDQVTARWQAQT